MTDSTKLNPEQLKAVKHKNGPLLIIAGAGTGKTTVITERVKHLITKEFIKPQEILALTFTEKAAREMETRIDEALPYGYTQMWVMTFHSFCDRILRREALHIGLDPRYKLTTEAEAIGLIRANLFNFDLNYFRPLGNPNKFIGGLLQHFSRLQDEDINPQKYLKWVMAQKEEKDKWLELANAYRTYDELKIKNGYMDFGDLIIKTLNLFRQRPNILKNYQNQFKYILIDEFQDTNFAQNELALLLSKKHKNIAVVGDDDQSVYRFRGAAISNILQFRKNFPKAKVVVLTKNYRSTQEILDKAYALVQNNNPDRLEVVEKIDKKLISQRKIKGEAIKFLHAGRVENEAEEVAKEIKKLIDEKKYDYKDFAILVRANNHADPFSRAMVRAGIPYQFLGPGRLFKQPEIVELISYLRVLNNFDDSPSFYKVLNIDHFGITPREVAAIGNYAKRLNLSLFEAAEKVGSEKVKEIISLVEKHLALIKKETAGQIVYYFLEDSSLLKELLSPDTAGAQKKATNISKFFDKLKTFETDHEDASVAAVVDWIDLATEVGESPLAADTDWGEVNAVNILTVHSAKGLEFPVVFLVNLVSLRFPTIERREQIPIPEALIKEVLPKGDFHTEEERRLFYVGMTRAKDHLFFTAADYYGEGKRDKKLSPFIFEALGDSVIRNELPKVDSQQLSFLDFKPGKESKSKSALEPIHIDYLSYSQIETFKTCPLHYKLRYILKIPTFPSASLSFGSTIHTALNSFYLSVKDGEKPTEKFLRELLEKNWTSEGYTSKAHEKKFFEKGKVYLSGFLKESFDPKNLPLLLEEPFTIPLGKIKIGGKIDRVDKLVAGSIEIIDYKTGATIPSQKEVDQNLQLSFYALAATQIPTEPFGKVPEKIKLSLYYLDQQQKITTTRTKEDLEKAKEEILKIKKQIETSDFKCSGSFLCQNCEYKLLCNSEE